MNSEVIITGKEMEELMKENRYYLGSGDIAIIHKFHLPKVIKTMGDYLVVAYNPKSTVFCKFDELEQDKCTNTTYSEDKSND